MVAARSFDNAAPLVGGLNRRWKANLGLQWVSILLPYPYYY